MPDTYGLPFELNGAQALAWIAWRTKRAVRAFTGPDADALWAEARDGRFPQGLGRPKVTPLAAEEELRRAVESGQVRLLAGKLPPPPPGGWA